jgi:hypothetical protein
VARVGHREEPDLAAGERCAEPDQPFAVQRDDRPLPVVREQMAMLTGPGVERRRRPREPIPMPELALRRDEDVVCRWKVDFSGRTEFESLSLNPSDDTSQTRIRE